MYIYIQWKMMKESHWKSEVFAWDGIIINQLPNSWDYEIWYTWYAEKSGFPRKHPDGLCTCVQLKTSQHWNLPSSLPKKTYSWILLSLCYSCSLSECSSSWFHNVPYVICSFWCFPTTKNPQPNPTLLQLRTDTARMTPGKSMKIMGSPAGQIGVTASTAKKHTRPGYD